MELTIEEIKNRRAEVKAADPEVKFNFPLRAKAPSASKVQKVSRAIKEPYNGPDRERPLWSVGGLEPVNTAVHPYEKRNWRLHLATMLPKRLTADRLCEQVEVQFGNGLMNATDLRRMREVAFFLAPNLDTQQSCMQFFDDLEEQLKNKNAKK